MRLVLTSRKERFLILFKPFLLFLFRFLLLISCKLCFTHEATSVFMWSSDSLSVVALGRKHDFSMVTNDTVAVGASGVGVLDFLLLVPLLSKSLGLILSLMHQHRFLT